MTEKRSSKKLLKLLLSLSIIAIFVWYLLTNTEQLKALIDLSLPIAFGILILNIARIQNNATFLRYSLQSIKKNIPHLEGFYIALITAIGNFFGPFMGGAGARGVYLKKQHDVSYSDYTATLSGFYVITFAINALVGLISLLIIWSQTGYSSFVVFTIFLGCFTFSLVLMLRFRSINGIVEIAEKRVPIVAPIIRYINRVTIGWHSIKSDRRLLFKLCQVTTVAFVIQYLIFYLEFVAIGVAPSISSLCLYVALSTFSIIVSITPGAIGVREAIFVFTSHLLGLTTDQILAVAVIDRAATFIVLFLCYIMTKIPVFDKYRIKQSE